MLIVLSPAKTLDESPCQVKGMTQPVFLDKSSQLIRKLQRLSVPKVKTLMGLSDKLAELNKRRYDSFSTPFTADNAKPAALMFMGDVYEGLQFGQFSGRDRAWSQDHLRILSGLYGLLRPLDLIQPYRLEMGTRFSVGRAGDLYKFWNGSITEQINAALVEQDDDLLVNLASNEYFGVVQPKQVSGRIVTPGFKEERKGTYQFISFFAKKARGMMARYLLTSRVSDFDGLRAFSEAGYGYNEALSTDEKPVFTRVS